MGGTEPQTSELNASLTPTRLSIIFAMATAHTAEEQIEKLREEIRHHEYLYYVLDTPVISDKGSPM